MRLVLQTNSQTKSVLKHITTGVSFLRRTQPCMKYIDTRAGDLGAMFFASLTGELLVMERRCRGAGLQSSAQRCRCFFKGTCFSGVTIGSGETSFEKVSPFVVAK